MSMQLSVIRCFIVIGLIASISYAGTPAGEAVHRYSIEQAAESFAKAHAGELDNWVNGYGSTDSHKQEDRHSLRSLAITKVVTMVWQMGMGTTWWETAPIPADFTGESVTFIWDSMVGIGKEEFKLLVADEEKFTLESTPKKSWKITGADGAVLMFDSMWTDDKGYNFGYMRLVAPAKWVTPGEPLKLSITGKWLTNDAWPNPFKYGDTIEWLKTGRLVAAFGAAQGGIYDGSAITFPVAARPQWAGKEVQLRNGGEVVATAALAEGEGCSQADVEIASYNVDQLSRPYEIVIDGKVEGTFAADPIRLKGHKLLVRRDEIARKFEAGEIPDNRYRAAAMVLGTGHYLYEKLTSKNKTMIWYLRLRGPTTAKAYAQLESALADFDAKEDVYAAKRGRFNSAYISGADSSGQLYTLSLPEDFKPGKQYALQIYLHGAGGWYDHVGDPPAGSDCIYVGVDGRGRVLYRGLGELDILEIIKDVSAHYNIDPDRISMTGGSMGGAGTWFMLSRYPDMFSGGAPKYGYAQGLYLENLQNVPFWVFHDETDYIVPVDAARVAVGATQSWGYPVIYTEASGGQHSSDKADPSWKPNEWLITQKRDPAPRQITYTTNTATRGKAYWVNILEMTDPNATANIRARAVTTGKFNQIFFQPTNIDILAMDLPEALFDRSKDLQITFDAGPLTVKAPLPERVYLQRTGVMGPHGTFALRAADPRVQKPFRSYSAGGLNIMYNCGEPVLIVKPADGDGELLGAIDKFCDNLSYRATGWGLMSQGKIPIKTDAELTDADIQNRNLIIVGPASANKYLAQITSKLPAVEANGKLTIGPETYELAGKVYGLFHYNPQAMNRLVYVISSPAPEGYSGEAAGAIRWSFASERPVGLIIRDTDPARTVRDIMWDKDWKPAAGAFDDKPLPKDFAKRKSADKITLEALRRVSNCDFVVYKLRRKGDDSMWDVDSARLHDLKASTGQGMDVYRTVLTGEQLALAVAKFDDEDKKLLIYPAKLVKKIVPDGRYRICIKQWSWRFKALTDALGANLPNIDLVRVDLYGAIERYLINNGLVK